MIDIIYFFKIKKNFRKSYKIMVINTLTFFDEKSNNAMHFVAKNHSLKLKIIDKCFSVNKVIYLDKSSEYMCKNAYIIQL